MMPSELQGAVIVGAVLAAIVGFGGFVWYAVALSRVFPKVGGESWKGWVPLLNEAEILARGGIPGWSVVYYFIPVLQLYGVYLKGVALLRINRKLGRGAGLMIVGLLFPPVWASVLGWGRVPENAAVSRDAAPKTAVRSAPTKATSAKPQPTMGSRVTDASGYAIPQSAPASLPQNPAAQLPVAQLQVAEEPVSQVPILQLPTAEVPAPLAPPAAPVSPVAALPPVAPVVAEIEIPPVPQAPPASPAPPAQPIVAEADLARPAQWNLRLDDGRSFSLTSARVELGRNPSSEDSTEQLVAIDDSTRTLSKTHARLTFGDGQWTVTDLKSTNGVMVVSVGGDEVLLESGASTVVLDRFVLGDVGMRLSFD